MAKAVLHCLKVKSAGDARRLAGHNNRSKLPSNADPSRPVQWLLPDQETDIWGRIESRVSALPKAKVRANSVKAVSMVLSASPEYFGDWEPDDERTQAWVDASMDWIKKEFGDLVVGAWAHFDEKSPHLHLHLVPGTEDGRLSAKERFGPRALTRYQTDYAKALSGLGIERGLEGSRAKHTPTRKWYADRDQKPKIGQVDVPPIIGRKQWAQEENKLLRQHQLGLVDKAQGRVLAEQRAREMAATAAAKERELAELRQERSRVRDIEPELVLEASGWERDPSDWSQWLHPGGSGAGRISLKGPKWYDHAASKGAGGAIDLTMHLHGFQQVSEAVGWLKDEFGIGATEGAYRARAADRAAKAVEMAPKPYKRPQAAPEAVGALEQWLIQIRKIRADLARSLVQAGAVFASKHGKWLNAIWPFAGNQGAEVRGITDPTFRGLEAGSRPTHDFWQHATGPDPIRLVVAESPLDAVSFHQLHPGPESTLVSTAGAKAKPADGLQELAKAHESVVVAYDRDEVGASCGPILAKWLGGRYQPPVAPAKDWNQVLQQQPAPGQHQAQNPSAGPKLG